MPVDSKLGSDFLAGIPNMSEHREGDEMVRDEQKREYSSQRSGYECDQKGGDPYIEKPGGSESSLDDIGYLDQEQLMVLTEQYRENRRKRGVSEADADWVRGPFSAWADSLKHDEFQLEPSAVAALAIGMRETLSIRDAIVLSLVAAPSCTGITTMIDIASHPHTARVRRRVERELHEAYHDPRRQPDVQRCRRGVDVLSNIAGMVPEQFRVQPLAVIAYVLWWIGDGRASSFAMHSLMIDAGCSLSSIVCSALGRGAGPAWRDKKFAVTPFVA